MSDYMTLMGAEQVQNAGHTIQCSANDFRRSVESLGCYMQRHQEFMQEWLDRLEAVIEFHNGASISVAGEG